MKHSITHLLAALGLLFGSVQQDACAAPVGDKLEVVATVPDLAWFAEQIGGERVNVKCLAKGTENLHSLSVRPRTIVSISKADVLLEMGLSLESTWLPELILTSRNRKIRANDPGRVTCSQGWSALDVPSSLSRQGGDVHPSGNPHFALSPLAGKTIAKNILDGLVRNDPAGESVYRKSYAALLARLDKAELEWKRYKELFQSSEITKKVVVYHMEFDYLLAYLGLETSIAIEPKPGVPPTPSHLAKVIATVREEKVPVILSAAWSRGKEVVKVAEFGKAKLLVLPTMVKGADWAPDWIKLIDGNMERMRIAFGLSELPELPAPKDEDAKQ